MKGRWWLVASILVGAVVVVVLVWFQPQKLLIDEQVNEAIPTAPTSQPDAETGTQTSTSASTAPVELARGDFVSLDHQTSGVVRVLELPGGKRSVRLEALDTDNGPDLFVYLATNGADGDEAAFDDEFVNLGRLKGNQGDQNYELPADVDLERFMTVVIWCDRFNSAFGAADLVTS